MRLCHLKSKPLVGYVTISWNLCLAGKIIIDQLVLFLVEYLKATALDLEQPRIQLVYEQPTLGNYAGFFFDSRSYRRVTRMPIHLATSNAHRLILCLACGKHVIVMCNDCVLPLCCLYCLI